MNTEHRQKHVKEFEMAFMSKDSSSKHMEMQEGFLTETLKRESAKMVGKQSSKKSESHHSQSKKIIRKVSSSKITQNDSIERNKFEFSFKSFLVELIIAYGCTIGICYLITVGNFPYFELLFVLGLMVSISPWSFSTLLMLSAMIITICNHYLNVTILTYPSIIICYMATLIFNEQYKVKIIFILVLVLQLAFGFALIPGLYSSFSDDNKQAFYYVFPIFMLLLRTMVSLLYWMIQHTSIIFLQTPMFIIGLEYGVILTLQTGYIQYWYLMVFFTLQIINERTQFVLGLLISMINRCRHQKRRSSEKQKYLSVLPAHSSGFSCINSLHIVCVVYIFTYLPLYSSPYTSQTFLGAYVQVEWYIPLTTWALASVYQIMCLILQRKRKDKLLIGYVKNNIPHTILRGLMLILGFWMFYLGLGIGNYMIYPNNTRTTT